MTLKKLIFLHFVACLLLLVGLAHADDETLLREAVRDYRAGTFLADNQDYIDLYASSKDRKMALYDVRSNGSNIGGFFQAEVDGTVTNGVVVFEVKEGKIVNERHLIVDPETLDLAIAGQMADVATTAVGIGAGLVEANPVMAPLTGSPAGFLALIGIKYAMVKSTESMSYDDCYASRPMMGSLGLGAAVSNLGMLIAPPIAIVAGVVTGFALYEKEQRSAAIECLSTLGDISMARIE